MSISGELRDTYTRFQAYIEELQSLIYKYGISGSGLSRYVQFSRLIGTNESARQDILRVLRAAAALEGGKLTLTTAGTLLGLAIGGIGVAGMGSAVGVPAAAVAFLTTAIGGLIGQELDSTGTTARFLTAAGLSPAAVGIHRGKALPTSTDSAEALNGLFSDQSNFVVDPEDKDAESQVEVIARLRVIENMLISEQKNAEAHAIETRAYGNRVLGRAEAIKFDTAQLLETIQGLRADVLKNNFGQAMLQVREQVESDKRFTAGNQQNSRRHPGLSRVDSSFTLGHFRQNILALNNNKGPPWRVAL